MEDGPFRPCEGEAIAETVCEYWGERRKRVLLNTMYRLPVESAATTPPNVGQSPPPNPVTWVAIPTPVTWRTIMNGPVLPVPAPWFVAPT
jgi:hypothetical protein